MTRGQGFSTKSTSDGIRKKNFIALSYYGPVLSYNVDLIHLLASMTGCQLQTSKLYDLIEENTAFIHGRFHDPSITKISAI